MTGTDPSETPLRSWVQTRLESIYAFAQQPEEYFRDFVNTTFSENAIIRHNHELVSKEEFLQRLIVGNFACLHASVNLWGSQVVEIPAGGDSEGGIIAGFFEVTRSLKYRIRAGPAQRESHNIFSSKVEDLGKEESGDRKLRISEFFVTSVNKAVPVHLQNLPGSIDSNLPEKTSGV
ncbi:hypothetical protein M413DRAFT_448832 [Hebeloma cylindrosporum]|uniref:NTF2 domain-containing protein n=1 Tax=Hebeloma cylindrosporum TaxID=76867 RepID=A0A0C2XG68_HEBCY|nr:hypothetical protein M413DRAFT_448832 [Hebeloma cylindrosporum h7]